MSAQPISSDEAEELTRGVLDSTVTTLETVEAEFSNEDKEWIARNLFWLVLQMPRGTDGVLTITMNWRQIEDQRDRARVALRLAGALLHLDVLNKVSGSLSPIMACSLLQGLLEHFMLSQGIPAWGCLFVEESKFEEKRHEWLRQEDREMYPIGAVLLPATGDSE